MTKTKTPEQVRADFRRRGLSFAEWARDHGFSRQLVSAVMNEGRKCYRGKSHRAAVLLGIKDGAIDERLTTLGEGA